MEVTPAATQPHSGKIKIYLLRDTEFRVISRAEKVNLEVKGQTVTQEKGIVSELPSPAIEGSKEGVDTIEDLEGGVDTIEDLEGGVDTIEDLEEGVDAKKDSEEGASDEEGMQYRAILRFIQFIHKISDSYIPEEDKKLGITMKMWTEFNNGKHLIVTSRDVVRHFSLFR